MKASQVIKQALKWENKNEADGSFKEIIDLYNQQKPLPRGYKVKYTDEWCATFVSAVAIKLKCTDIIPTECSCQRMIDKFKEIGCWQEDESVTPKIGWIIFYDWNDTGISDCTGWADHVGIVAEINNNKIVVIEGNYNNKVTKRTISINNRYIRGYGMPKYEEDSISDVYSDIYFKKYTGKDVSIVNALKSIGEDSSYLYRCKIARANNINNYIGSAKHNTTMLNLLKNGVLIKP